ncbi:MAG TPA: hypothetical protein VGF23_07585 [Gaiellaceae bacterium]
MRPRFWSEVVLASASGFLFVLTLFWKDWLEAFGWDPDGGNGAVEWLIAAALLAAAFVFGALARREWRRTAATQAQ